VLLEWWVHCPAELCDKAWLSEHIPQPRRRGPLRFLRPQPEDDFTRVVFADCATTEPVGERALVVMVHVPLARRMRHV